MLAQLNYISYPYIKDQNKGCNELTAIMLLSSRYCDFYQLFHLAVDYSIVKDAIPDAELMQGCIAKLT